MVFRRAICRPAYGTDLVQRHRERDVAARRVTLPKTSASATETVLRFVVAATMLLAGCVTKTIWVGDPLVDGEIRSMSRRQPGGGPVSV